MSNSISYKPTMRAYQNASNLNKGFVRKILKYVFVSLVLWMGISLFILLVENDGSFLFSKKSFFEPRFLAILLGIIVLALLSFNVANFWEKAFKWRWLIGCILLIVCVICNISGSSIGLSVELLGGANETVFGVPRIIRSDEYVVYTPMAISQFFTDTPLSYFSDTMRATLTDMFCVYGQPVMDIAIIFRPFQWGYLFLGPVYGTSFLWCARNIFLFLVALEFGYRILCKENKKLALGFAVLVAFGSPVQWWFVTNNLGEMLTFGMLALILFKFYLSTNKFNLRFLYSLAITWCLVCFIFGMYPAWEVPLGYVFFGLLIVVLIENKGSYYFSLKDFINIATCIILIALSLVYVLIFKSAETIEIVSNTVYPGNRVSTGGDGLTFLLAYPLTILYSIKPEIASTFANVCEASVFYAFFPLCVVLPIYNMIHVRKISSFYVVGLVLVVIFGMYCVFGVPEILAQITLLSKTTGVRADVILSFVMVLLFIRSVSDLANSSEHSKKTMLLILIVSLTVVVAQLLYFFTVNDLMVYLGIHTFIVSILILALAFFFACYLFNPIVFNCFIYMCLVIGLMQGFLVNPIVNNLSNYLDSDTLSAIQEYDEDQDIWAVANSSFMVENLPFSVGAATINSTNTYPNLELWHLLDSDNEYSDVYNRYAHIKINTIDTMSSEALFELDAPDAFTVNLDAEGLKKIGVTKLFSQDGSLENLSTSDVMVQKIWSNDSLCIYSVG